MSQPLPSEKLHRQRLVFSMSDSEDVARLGLSGAHIGLVLAEVTRAVLIAGGTVGYGGHLGAGGFTELLFKEVERYGSLDYPALLICLAWTNHRELALGNLEAKRSTIEDFAEIVFLDPDGNEVDPEAGRGADAVPVPPEERAPALTAMRHYLEDRADARVAIGGRRHGFEGRIPGLLEELCYAVERGKPLYLAGGLGGATLDVAGRLGAGDTGWFPAMPQQAVDPRYARGLEELVTVRDRTGWALDNGLDEAENARLTATPRPSEIAGLVAAGLYRRLGR